MKLYVFFKVLDVLFRELKASSLTWDVLNGGLGTVVVFDPQKI
jgi:hypothetical protein